MFGLCVCCGVFVERMYEFYVVVEVLCVCVVGCVCCGDGLCLGVYNVVY